MASVTDVCNDALSQIGATRITSIDDGSVNANHCKVFYDKLRQALLRMHHWNFAEDRAELARDAQAPAFEYAYAYTLPADFLKIKEYNGASVDTTRSSTTRFKIEGRKLLTNDGEVKVVFVKDVTDPNMWDALFYQVMTTWLASKLASAIIKSEDIAKSKLEDAVGLLLPIAAAVDGQEGAITPYVTDDLTWGR